MDINCDLGENEHPLRTRALMRRVTSANIACGGHAGTSHSIRRCLRLCADFGVRPGLHPGYADKKNFGRKTHPLSPTELTELLRGQVETFLSIAKEEGLPPTHIKLHGALYHAVENDSALAAAYARFVRANLSRLCIYASPGGQVIPAARACGIPAWREIFADRAYLANGELVPRTRAGAVLEPAEIRARLILLARTGSLQAIDGTSLSLSAKTICVHADSPRSLSIATHLANIFKNR